MLVAVPAAIVVFALAVVTGAAGMNGLSPSQACLAAPVGPDHLTGVGGEPLGHEQVAYANVIITVGVHRGLPARAEVIALATALQESGLRNLPPGHGDLDSVGLFQQRPSQGWGTPQHLLDPQYAATAFYQALTRVPHWQTLSLKVAAQTVQKSSTPDAYAKWEPEATALVTAAAATAPAGLAADGPPHPAHPVSGEPPLGCSDPITGSLPTGAAGAMVRVALAQQGDPYVWGATGPDAFDCSGLVIYSWAQAGYRVTVRTAAQMYRHSTPIQAGSEQPGDLLFGDFGPVGAGHVMIVVRPGIAVQAPSTGRNVQITTYTADGAHWRLGRLRSSALRPLTVSD
jgi:cell wall-associated NlpC family hydrolase